MKDQDTSTIEPTSFSTPEDVQPPSKSYGRNWKKIIAIYLTIAVILYGAIYYFVLNKQKANPYSPNKSTPLVQASPTEILTQSQNSQPEIAINSIYEKVQTLKNTDILIDKNPKIFTGSVWWVSDDNYNILIPTSSFLRFHSKAINEDFGDNTYVSVLSKPGMQKFFDIAASEMKNQGFNENSKNSSSSFTDTKYVDYVQAYEKGKTKCTITVDPSASGLGGSKKSTLYFSISVGCTDDFDTSYAEQQPFLKALNIHDAVVHVQKHEGGFYMLNVNFRRTGHYTIVKKEGETYREIVSGQDVPPCDKMETNQVPKSIYGGCYDAKTGTTR